MAKIIGEGEIEEIVRGKKYYIRHHLGKDKKMGKYARSPRRVVHGNKAEARRQLELYRRELELTWENVDLGRRRIHVVQQYANDRRIRAPKSENSMRWIGIDDGTVAFLGEWKAQQAREMEVQGMDQGPQTPVCTSATFGLIDPNAFSRWRRQFFVEHGLGHYETVTQFMPNAGREVSRRVYVGYNFHELRHTQATLLIGQGADIKTVQHRLGHSSASLTMDVYAHAIPANDEVAAGIMGDVLGSRDERPQAAPSPSRQPAQEPGITRELIGTLLAQLPPEKLVEMLRASG